LHQAEREKKKTGAGAAILEANPKRGTKKKGTICHPEKSGNSDVKKAERQKTPLCDEEEGEKEKRGPSP